jgi:hypothetical protein
LFRGELARVDVELYARLLPKLWKSADKSPTHRNC